MNMRLLLIALIAAYGLSACATAKRGSKQMFMVQTSPPGAKVETTLVEGTAPRLSKKKYKAIKSGAKPEPELKFKSCEPTPCSFKLPRKQEFEILVSKEGYASQTHIIDHFHRKEIAKQIKRETALVTALAGTGAAVAGAGVMATGISVISLGTASASTGMVAGAAVVAAAPVVGLGLISMGVDSGTGANYDYWPNPAALTLEVEAAGLEGQSAELYDGFDEARRAAIIRPFPTSSELVAEKKKHKEDRKARLENNRLFKDYVETAPPDLKKPQSSRRERRAEKNRKRAAERAARETGS